MLQIWILGPLGHTDCILEFCYSIVPSEMGGKISNKDCERGQCSWNLGMIAPLIVMPGNSKDRSRDNKRLWQTFLVPCQGFKFGPMGQRLFLELSKGRVAVYETHWGSINKGPLRKRQYTMILRKMTPKKGPLIFGKHNFRHNWRFGLQRSSAHALREGPSADPLKVLARCQSF